MELVEALTIFTAAADVVSVPVQLKDVVLVQAVMLLTVAEPLLSVTVPHTMRGEACVVLEQVVVVPHILTFCGKEVNKTPESAGRPALESFTASPEVNELASV